MADPIVGDSERITITITSFDGAAADPTTLTLEIKDPSGNVTTYTYAGGDITKSSTGVYYKVLPVYDEAGRWDWEWQAAGAVNVVSHGSRYVQAQLVTGA